MEKKKKRKLFLKKYLTFQCQRLDLEKETLNLYKDEFLRYPYIRNIFAKNPENVRKRL